MFKYLPLYPYSFTYTCVSICICVWVCTQLMPWFVSRCPYAARQGRAYGHLVEDRNTTNKLWPFGLVSVMGPVCVMLMWCLVSSHCRRWCRYRSYIFTIFSCHPITKLKQFSFFSFLTCVIIFKCCVFTSKIAKSAFKSCNPWQMADLCNPVIVLWISRQNNIIKVRKHFWH